ncbi:folate-binding protein YgfZ [Caulobacter sp. 17J65-9]|nr:folate-binding protein YgfZ [Caulobacter sp. 17J65-9]NEX93476.1 folate-binding protein YgfZ [Caulobacter sp. 17J65-9]
MTVSLARLDSRALLRVTGPDRASFLQGLLTNDVESLAPGEARFAALLTPQGKFLFDLFVIAEPDALLLDVQAERRADLARRLAMYKLRAKAEIAEDDRAVFALWGQPAPEGDALWVADARLPALGLRGYGAADPTAAEDAYEAHRLALGVPDPARDCLADKTFPIEADFDLLHGVDFKKGCFVGQETTSRMKRRGQIKNRMLPIAFEGPAPAFGAEVLAGSLRAGEVLSGRDGRAMALVRLDRIDGVELTVDGRPVRIERPAWFPDVEPL